MPFLSLTNPKNIHTLTTNRLYREMDIPCQRKGTSLPLCLLSDDISPVNTGTQTLDVRTTATASDISISAGEMTVKYAMFAST